MRPLRRRAACAALALVAGLSLALLMSFGRSAGISGQLELEPVDWLDIAGGNTGVGLLLAAGGLLGGLPTIVILAYNGLLFGAVLGEFLGSAGGFARFLLVTAPHGLVEIPALILLGAVGLGIATHMLQLLGLRWKPPPAARLARESLVALLMLLTAAVIEAKLTPPFALAAWSGAATHLWLDTSLRWSAILVLEAGTLLALSRLFDRIDRAPAQIRRVRGKLASLSAPVWAVLMATMCASLNQVQVEVWRSTQSVGAMLFFMLGCGFPPLLYTVARGHRAQLDEPKSGLSIHAPWLIRAVLLIGASYAILGTLYRIAPGLNGIALVFSCGLILLTLISLTVPFMLRKWSAIEYPMDWSSPKARVAAELVDRLGFPRSRVHLLEPKGGNRVVNAMATGFVPGGARIFVTVDLIEKLTADEIAAVFAHEIGHVRARHLSYAFVLQIGLLIFLNAALFVTRTWVRLIEPLVLGGVVYAIVITTLGAVLLPLSIAIALRAAERQADHYAADSGWGEALASALERLPGPDPDSEDTPRIIRAFSLHPSRTSRITALRSAVSE